MSQTASRTGFELELLAPSGLARVDLARAIAARRGGRLEFGLKHLMTRLEPDGSSARCCELMPAVRVRDPDGTVFATLVDDLSIRQGLLEGAPPAPDTPSRVVLDDDRIASWVARNSFSPSPALGAALGPFLESFGLDVGAPGHGPRCHPTHRLVRDPHGAAWAVVAPYGDERERVCEVVLRPLDLDERAEVLEELLSTARSVGFTAAPEGAVHVHYDAGPWRSTARLTELIRRYTEARDQLLLALKPNPNTPQWRGPFSRELVSWARSVSPDLPFDSIAAMLETSGWLQKNVDLNLLGVVRERHPQHTLEVRILPVSLEANALLGSVASIEAFLAGIPQSASRLLEP